MIQWSSLSMNFILMNMSRGLETAQMVVWSTLGCFQTLTLKTSTEDDLFDRENRCTLAIHVIFSGFSREKVSEPFFRKTKNDILRGDQTRPNGGGFPSNELYQWRIFHCYVWSPEGNTYRCTHSFTRPKTEASPASQYVSFLTSLHLQAAIRYGFWMVLVSNLPNKSWF